MKRSFYSFVWTILALLCILWPVAAFCNYQNAFIIDAHVGNFTAEISPILPQTILEDKISQPIPFTLTDPYHNEKDISLLFESDNHTIVPNENIAVEGSGKNRFLVITPLPMNLAHCP
jgi:hypothetical protein